MMARSPITQLIEDFHNLSIDEQKLFLDLVDPQPEEQPKPKVKRKSKGGKSARASQMSEQIKANLNQRAKEPLCACGNEEGFTDHAQPSPNFHEFQTAKVAGVDGGD